MRAAKAIIIILCLLILITTHAWADSSISATAYYVFDLTSGQMLSAKNEQGVIYPASLTKLMTAYLVMENGQLSDQVSISLDAVGVVGTRAYLKIGEVYTVSELLQALLISSANDAAIALAEYVAGSQEDFVILMNKKAEEWGLKETHFTNPHGLHDKNHRTTAKEFAIIVQKSFGIPKIVETCAQTRAVISNPAEGFDRLLINTNDLIKPTSKYHFVEAVAGKTGYTSAAGQCVALLAKRGNEQVVTIVFNAKGQKVWTDAITLSSNALNEYDLLQLLKRGAVLGSFPLRGAKEDVCYAAINDFAAVVKSGEEITIDSRVELNEKISLPIAKGQELGNVEFLQEGRLLARVPIVATFSVASGGFAHSNLYLLVPVLFGIFMSRIVSKKSH